MKNPTDTVTAIILLALCGIGAKSVNELPGASGIDIIGPATFPKTVLILLTLCSAVLLGKNFCSNANEKYWPEFYITKKIFFFLLIIYLYLIILVWLGNWFAEMEKPLFHANGGFGISTFLFLLVALPYLGKRRLGETLLIASITTGMLIGIFSFFFQVQLP
ncbi:MAG: tripartite tricarboxylate transporter TctB family protein [Desulfovibrio sp.]|jgi:hypothetical protein|nr:tripartite tricarboxylate transporter TctB family protein [Desulfovibrio sp.]